LAIFMAAVMIAAAALLYNISRNSTVATNQFLHSAQITGRLKDVLNTLTAAETAERGYLLTRNEIFLEPYIADNEKNPDVIKADSLLALMPEYANKIKVLNNLVKDKLYYVQSAINIAKNTPTGQKTAIGNTTVGKVLMDSIRTVINNIQTLENLRIKTIYETQASDNREVYFLLVADVTVCLVLLFIFYQMVLRNTRLREKTEAGLLEAKNIAEAADKAKTNFLAIMSHEIRTPMHDIIATSALLAETGINDEQQAHANNIYRGSMALLAVVNDIIDFSRIESGKIPLENTAFVLHDCLDEVFAAAGLPPNQNRTVFHIDNTIPKLIECDPTRLRQVLMSILGDKPKEIENGELGLSVRLLRTDNDIMDVRFTIMNTLSGLFDREDGVTDEDEPIGANKSNLFGVSSLRFSIAARLISLMGGNIKLTDDSSRGSTVTFTIKAKKVAATASELFFSQRKKFEQFDNQLANKLPLRILVVDDHEMNQVLLVQILAKMGYTCKTAHNGSEAYGLAIETRFDMIFMDIVMPVMDGIEATKRIREYYLSSDTPVIIGITANALMHEGTRATDAGMKDFLIKPYKPIDIQSIVKKWAPVILKPKYEA